VGLAEYSDEAVNDPKVVALRALVKVTTDPAVPSDEIFMTIKMKDGKTLEKHVLHAVGSLERPMSDGDLEEKFKGLTKGVLPDAQAAELLAMCWKLEGLTDISALAKAGAKREVGKKA
jgi:2-methylcitrate dehydratase PrpD